MLADHQIPAPKNEPDRITRVFLLLTGGDDAGLCKEIPESACKDQPGNFFRHLLASVGSKLSDEVASPRLVLPWLLSHLGGGGAAVAWLLPIREAGTLVPQLLIAAWLRHLPLRKYAWAFGGFVQGLSALGMAAIALLGSGPASTWGVLGLLLLLALGRGVSSIATKDVLGKTIAKSRRGALMGWSESASSVIALVIGLLLPLLGKSPERSLLALLLLVAVAGWWINAALALAIREKPGATEGEVNTGRAILEGFGLLSTDRVFLRFNLTRGLLLGSVLSLPYLVVLARKQSSADMTSLGLLLIISNLVVLLTSPAWGRWSDRSSSHVMAAGGALAGLATAAALFLPLLQGGWTRSIWTYGLLYGVLVAAHTGIQIGRKTWVVDFGGPNRAMYVAMSNTLAGLLTLVAGAVTSFVAHRWGDSGALALMTVMALAGAVTTVWNTEQES